MPDKLDRQRGTFARLHDELFTSGYEAEFINTTQGTRSNLDDSYSGESKQSIGTINVEIVPPAIDSTVRQEGTSFSWDTSIRFPLAFGDLTVSEDRTIQSGETLVFNTVVVKSGVTLTVNGTLVTETLTVNGTTAGTGQITVLNETFPKALKLLGEDNERPTLVDISDPKDDETDRYELHGYSYEKGSGMLMCRLVEQ